MKQIKLILFLISIIIFSSCNRDDINDKNKRNQNWVWWIDAKTGKGQWIPVRDQTTVTDGQYTEFYFNGNPYEHGKLLNGNPIDTIFRYDIQGKLREYDIVNPSPTCNCNYRIDNKVDTFCEYIVNDGAFKRYTPAGILSAEGNSKNHAIYGVLNCYDEDGKKQYERNFIKDSTWRIEYYENGQKKDSCYDFKNVGFFTLCTEWFQDGQLKAEGEWRRDGIQEGTAKIYTENDTSSKSIIKSISNWKNGHQDGLTILYYENTGKINKMSHWKDGIQNGIFIHYYQNGQIADSCNVINGKTDGLRKTWYENGKISLISFSKNGSLISEEKFDEDGILQPAELSH
jgi:antitoxin component YwqK of YwqJK toxin-antitoxin module